MYNLKKKILKIKHSFKIINSLICFNTIDDEIIIRDIEEEEDILKVDEKSAFIGIVFNTFYYNNKDNSFSKILNLDTNKIEKLPFLINNSIEKLLFAKKREHNLNKILLSDKTFQIIWESEVKIGKNKLFTIENIFFTEFLNDSNIVSLETISGNQLWNYNLSDLGVLNGKPYEVRKFIGIWQDQLFVACGNNTIIALNIKTGKLLEKWYQFDEVLKYNEYTLGNIPYAFCTILDTEKEMLIGFNFFVCWQINLKTHQLEVIDMGDILKENKLKSFKNLTGFAISKTHYFLTAETPYYEPKNRFLDSLVAINKDTLKIDWQYQFPDTLALGVNAPQYANNKLYQLDWDNTLHIFEKQENIA